MNCPNADSIIDRAQKVASTHSDVTVLAVLAVLVEDGRPVPAGFAGSPTVLIDGTNPFAGTPTDAPRAP